MRYAAEAFAAAIKYCTEQNKDVEDGPDDRWEDTVSECWNDLGDVYARQSLALAETPAWQKARLREEEQQTGGGIAQLKQQVAERQRKARAAAKALRDGDVTVSAEARIVDRGLFAWKPPSAVAALVSSLD